MESSRRARPNAAEKRGREVAATDSNTSKRRTSSSTDDQARGRRREEQQQQQQGYDPKQQLPNLASHFAALTKAVLNRVTDGNESERVYDDFMQSAKMELIGKLKRTYHELETFYNDPTVRMPEWLSKSPPVKTFLIHDVDVRLHNRGMQIEQDLRAFVEEQGFVCEEVTLSILPHFPTVYLSLRLDVATVPTTRARKRVHNRLLTLESALNGL